MAGNNYKMLIEARLDPSKVKADIEALAQRSVLFIQTKFEKDTKGLAELNAALEEIKAKATNIDKISIFGDKQGNIAKATVEYKDALGNAVKQYIQINDQIKIEQQYTDNVLADQKQINQLLTKQENLTARQADEMERAALQADKFLEKSKSMSKTPAVSEAMGKAQEIKVAVQDKDIDKVRKLSDELKIMQSGLEGSRKGLLGWSDSIGAAIKQTVSYALSVGLVYGALNELKKGIGYIKELDKEMTNIQVLRIEGAKTNTEIASLAMKYNDLADALGSTTIDVAKGSVEWLN